MDLLSKSYWKEYYRSWSIQKLIEERERLLEDRAAIDSVPMSGRELGYGMRFVQIDAQLDAIDELLQEKERDL
jgi:hypothetical protein